MKCDRCGITLLVAQKVVDPEDDKVYCLCPRCGTDYNNCKTPVREFCRQEHFPLELSNVFECPGKTLKLKVKQGTLIEDAFKHALVYLNSQSMYTRIEFKHGTSYIVVAKLKEE